ncbi:MAG: hypothetical protein JXO48_01385 [Deltaproteobacteria bacterium]|nr:hypothetical protein [Deltaproteobacteria bacterium]
MNRTLFRWVKSVPGCCALLLLFLAGCSAGSAVSTRHFVPESTVVCNAIAVAPFQTVPVDVSRGEYGICPLCGMMMRSCPCRSSGDPCRIVEDLFLEGLRERKSPSVIPGEKVAAVYRRILTDSFTLSQREVMQALGRELQVDHVLAGYVFCYRERKGYAYSVDTPSSVVFSVHLVRVEDGALVWRGIFDKTQSSLFENLLSLPSFIRERGKWVTAGRLAEEGVTEILRTFPGTGE